MLDMRQPLQEHAAQSLFDVEIGQFESVSFNFSQLTGPPWVPHIPLIGYKLVFLSSRSLGFENPLFSFSLTYYSGTPVIFLSTFLLFLTERSCGYTPRCLSNSQSSA